MSLVRAVHGDFLLIRYPPPADQIHIANHPCFPRLHTGSSNAPDIAINFLKAQEIGLRIPFSVFESAAFVYDYGGLRVRNKGKSVPRIMWPPPTQ